MVNFCSTQKFENVALDKLPSSDFLFAMVRDQKCDFKLEVTVCWVWRYLVLYTRVLEEPAAIIVGSDESMH